MSQLLSRVFCSMFDSHFVPVVTLTTRRRCYRSNLQVDAYVWWTESNRKWVTEAAVTMETTGVFRGGKMCWNWSRICSYTDAIFAPTGGSYPMSLCSQVKNIFLQMCVDLWALSFFFSHKIKTMVARQQQRHLVMWQQGWASQAMTQRRNPPEPKQASCRPSLWSCSCRDAVSTATCLEHCSLRICSGYRCQSTCCHQHHSYSRQTQGQICLYTHHYLLCKQTCSDSNISK